MNEEFEVLPATAENILGMVPQLPNLFQRIEEIAVKLCPDYPDVKTISSYEQLWAIEQGYLGTRSACEDWHDLVKILQENYKIPEKEIVEISKNLLAAKYSKE